MKRLLPFVLALLLLTGCAAAPAAPTEPADTSYTFTDSLGNAVVLPDKPQTVAVLFSSYAEIWTVAGGEISVTVGETVERGFAPEGTPLVDAGAGKTIDCELLIAYQPDFVIASADIPAQVEACEMLRQSGIPAALFRVDTFQDYLAMLKICTDITGNSDAYQTHGIQVAQEIDAILAAVDAHLESGAEAPQILFIRAGSQYSSTKAKRAPDNFVCVMLQQLGAHNIADDADILLDTLSLEEILLRDPDYIFLTTMGSEEAARDYVNSLFAEPGWQDLTAVKNGRYTFLEKNLFHFKPNQNWAQAYRLLAGLLYPDLEIP